MVATIDHESAFEIQLRAMRECIEFIGRSSDSGLVIERDGVVASMSPICPDRSIANSVVYGDGTSLTAQLDDLAMAYAGAGIIAWTVWAPEFDRPTIDALERAGHHFDGNPAAMVLDLDGFEPPPVGDLDWDAEATIETVAQLNDRAYGHPHEQGFGRAFQQRPDGLDLRMYQARADGEPASVVATIDHPAAPGMPRADCGIYWVATHPDHRGRGLTTRLLGLALAHARERGCGTSSLQSSAMGYPIYERLGYRTHYRWNMYERRRA
jgi:GNAT superfamily N-acetyltransferase